MANMQLTLTSNSVFLQPAGFSATMPTYYRGKGICNGLRALSCAVSGCRTCAKAKGIDAEGRPAMHPDWNRPVEHVCRDDAPPVKFNSTRRHLALDELKVSYGEWKTVGLFSIWDTLDKRYTTSPVSD